MTHPAPVQGGAPAAPAPAAPAPAVAPVSVSRSEVSEFVTRMIARHGTTENALSQLAQEQIKYRKRAQRAEGTAAELQKKVPADGSVVLIGAEAKAYTDLKAAGVTLDKVPESLKTLKELQTKDTTQTRESALTEAAGDKYKVKVLKKLIGDLPLEFKKVNVKVKDPKTQKDTIQEQKVPYIVIGDTKEPLDDYLAREHEDFMDILVVDEEEDGEVLEGTSEARPARRARSERTEDEGEGGAATVRQVGTKKGGKDKDGDASLKAVEKQLAGKYVSPGQRNKTAGDKS